MKQPKRTKHLPASRRSLAFRYGLAMRTHPLRTILTGAVALTVLLVCVLGTYYALVYKEQVHGWQDAPVATVGQVAPLPHWQDASHNIDGGSTVKVVSDATKTKAIQFYGPADTFENTGGYPNQRAELVPKTADIKPGQTVWIGLDVWIGQGLGIAKDFQQIMQLKNDVEGSPTLALTVNEQSEELGLRRNDGPAGTPNYSKSLGTTAYNAWTRLVIGLQVTRSGDSSTVEAWRDNAPKLLRENWPAYNQAGDGHAGGLLYDNATSAFLKFGLYRAPQAWPMEVRLANIKIASTQEAVQ